ncbi:MAG: hypothetical protein E2O39_06895 [Planctomycetota bacterium]|nr:MAG: hypothetical protein E2O39_06895 [Planctomycetota bacterium]
MNAALLAVLLVPRASPPPPSQDVEPDPPPVESTADTPWGDVILWLREQRDTMAAELETAHARLLPAAEESAPKLAKQLEQAPPTPRPTGYGILPEVKASGPLKAVTPTERTYSLEVLSTGYVRDFRDARMLAWRVAQRPDPGTDTDVAELEREVKVFVRLRGRLRNLEDHLAYHEWWQAAVVEQRDYFEDRSRIVWIVRERQALEQRHGPAERIAELTRTIHEEIAPFKPAAGLVLEDREDGWRVLRVTVATDILDEEFLKTLSESVDAVYNDSEAARERRLRIELVIERIPLAQLYPEGVPEHGAAVDVEAQVACFPEGRLVLTTGAKSTHAWAGRSLLLGPSPITRRTLAHEFGHLLGFTDAYLRGFEGDPAGDFGVKLVEWTGLLEDLMGNPAGGIVTLAMIDRLIEAYGGQ